MAHDACATGLIDTAIEKFLTDSYSDTDAAIGDVVASGAPQSAALLDALSERRLFFSAADKSVTYKDSIDKAFDARTGSPIPSVPADAQIVRVNNRLRGTIAAAIGTLTLMSPDPIKRVSISLNDTQWFGVTEPGLNTSGRAVFILYPQTSQR